MHSISLSLLGAAQSIGRSCRVFSFKDGFEKTVVVIDAGTNPHPSFIRENFEELFPDLLGLDFFLRDATRLHIIISHAHLDHAGGLPVLFSHVRKYFSRLSIHLWMTKETWVLSNMSWDESMRTMSNQGDRYPEWEGVNPFFTQDTIDEMSLCVRELVFGEQHELAPEISLTSRRAGHILGAISVDMSVYGERVFDTGDISFNEHPFIKSANLFFSGTPPKVLVSEATYAGQLAQIDREEAEMTFAHHVKRVVQNKGGIALIPAFQLDRAQVIAEILVKNGVPQESIRLDGGASRVTRLYRGLLPQGTLSKVRYVRNQEERDNIVSRNYPGVIIASGGMMHGIALFWAKNLLSSEKNGIFLNGWYEACTPADILFQASNESTLDKKTVEFETGESIPVNAEIHKINLSAHADGMQLESFWGNMDPKNLVLTHGDRRRVQKYIKKVGHPGIHFPPTRNRRKNLVVLDF